MARTLTKSNYIDWLPSSVPASAIDALPSIPIVTSVAAVQSVEPSEHSRLILSNDRREQTFVWRTDGDYTSRVNADIFNGRYIQKTGVSPDGTSGGGCWVALPKNPCTAAFTSVLNGRFRDDEWWTSEFGAVGDQATDDAPALSAMINLANIDKPGNLRFNEGIYSLYSALPDFAYSAKITGKRAGGNQMPILYKRYAEGGAQRGILAFGQHAPDIDSIQMSADAALASGGSGMSFTVPSGLTLLGDAHISRCRISCGDGVNYSLLIEGIASDLGVPGYRHLNMTECSLFGAANGALRISGGRQILGSNQYLSTAGGTNSAGTLVITGTASIPSDNVHIRGTISGKIALDRCTRGLFVTYIAADVDNTANTTRTVIVGPHYSGTVQANWLDNSGLITP